MLLEAAADKYENGIYTYALTGSPLRFDWRDMIREIVSESSAGAETGAMAARFMNTLIDMAVRQCRSARAETGIESVVLSGGTFQNMYLMKRLPEKLRAAGFTVYHHSRVSTNDEGISLGQLMVAQHQLERK